MNKFYSAIVAFIRSGRKARIIGSLAIVDFFLVSTLLTGYIVQRNRISSPAVKGLENLSSLYLTPTTANLNPGAIFDVQVYLLPNNNPVSGVDAILKYNSSLLKVVEVTKSASSPFNTFLTSTDSSKINFSALSYSGNAPTTPVGGTSAIPLANIKLQALSVGATNISFDYAAQGTTDSNVSTISGGGSVDALQPPSTQVAVVIQIPTPTPSPVPTPAPTPTPTPSPSPSPTNPDQITVQKAVLSSVSRTNKKLEVTATSTGAPNVTLTVVGFGNLRYSSKTRVYSRIFSTTQSPVQVTITSSGGGSVTAPVAQ